MPRPATGSITETKTGWRLRFRAHGQRHTQRLTFAEAPKRRDAQERLDEILADVRRGLWQPSRAAPTPSLQPEVEPTFQEFAESWYAAKWPTLAESTREDYEWRLNKHLLPWFATTKISAFTVAAVDEYRDAKLAAWHEAKIAGERAAGPESINKTLVLLRAILDLALERDLLERNPLAINPRNRKVRIRREDRPQRTYLDSADQITALLDAASELDANASTSPGVRRAAVALLTYSGIRIQEATALRWRHVNLADARITVHGTKTGAADRVVPMLPALRDELVAWKLRSPHARADDPVLANGIGTPLGANNIRQRIVQRAQARANATRASHGLPALPHLTPHSLRRTAVSLWTALGWPMTDAMTSLGHASPTLTLTVYAHGMQLGDRQRDALSELAGGREWDRKGTATPKSTPHGPLSDAA